MRTEFPYQVEDRRGAGAATLRSGAKS